MIETFAAIYAICAVVYATWFSHRAASLTGSLIKPIPAGLLAGVAIMLDGSAYLIAGLVLSAIGDFAVSRDGKTSFLVGLASAAIGRLAYVFMFGSVAIEAPPLLPVFGFLIYAAATETWLTPYTDDLRGPVRVYVLLFTIMVVMALAVPVSMEMAMVGALIFVAADTLFGIRLFRITPASRWYIPVSVAYSSLYYTSQFLICFAFIG